MPANAKAGVFATEHVTHGGRRYRPGERMDGAPEHAIRSALESGAATDVASRAEQAKQAESERQRDVDRQIATRSEKREHVERQRLADVPRLVQMPDGSYARLEE